MTSEPTQPVEVEIRRTVRLPDPVRVERSLRAPELGPRVLFFSGGTALRATSRELKHYTHNSIHLITPFDSGGSSASLRAAFAMLSVGDLRNRLIALADESVLGNPEIYRLFSHRLDKSVSPAALAERLQRMIRGEDALVASIPHPLRQLVRTHLRLFAKKMPDDFDLRGASVGNLLLAGGYLSNQRDMDSVSFLFSQLLEVRGTVRATADADLHLAAELEDGTRVVGQMMLTGKEAAPIQAPVARLFLVDATAQNGGRIAQRIVAPGEPFALAERTTAISEETRSLIATADVIVFPMGSIYSSVMANLLPTGVGAAIAARDCPKVVVPNTTHDPEAAGRSHAELVAAMVALLRADAGDVPVSRLVTMVLADADPEVYAAPFGDAALAAAGIPVVRMSLCGEARPLIDADRLAQALVSLG